MSSSGRIAIVLPPAGYPGAALLALRDRLQSHGVPYLVAAAERGRCLGSGGVTISATVPIARLPDELGGLVLLDGEEARLAADSALVERLIAARRANLVIGAIGFGVLALAAAGLLHSCAVAADERTAERLRRAGAAPLYTPLSDCNPILTATEAGAAALGDALHDLRGPSELGPGLTP
jgi:hypothetical protein